MSWLWYCAINFEVELEGVGGCHGVEVVVCR